MIKFMLLRVPFGSKGQYLHFFGFPIIFPLFMLEIYPNPIFSFLLIKMDHSSFIAQVMQNNSHFHLFLSNEITVDTDLEFYTLAMNSLKAIATNKGNYLE